MSRPVRLSGCKKRRTEKRRLRQRRERGPILFEALEPRVVLSADLAWAFDLPADPGQPDVHVEHGQGHAHRMQFEFHGGRFYSEPLITEAAPAASEDAGDGTVWQGYDLSQTFFLNSKPDAEHTVYLDVDGHVTSGTAWNAGFNSGADIVTPAWSADGDPDTFTDSEKATIQRIWARVAEDYAPFNVNVTTEEPPLDDLVKSDAGDTRWGTRAVIGPNTWYKPAGGVAYVGAFNWNSDTPCFVFNTSENGITEATSHEVGHTLGLGHDGDSASAYYSGHGSGATSWGPIMGSSYNVTLSQWSQGEYDGANNQQDDLAIIAGQNGFSYRADDYGDVFAEAQVLLNAGQSQIDASYGIIETSADVDTFSFLAGAGPALIQIDPFAVGANLDVMAELYDGIGTLIASSNPVDDIDAVFDLDLAIEGQYFLQVSGTGAGDALTDGYTDYGSLGNYRIEGTVAAYSAGNVAPVASDDQQSAAVDQAVTIDVLANDYDADGDLLTVDSVTQGSNGSVVVHGDNTITYTPQAGFSGVDTFAYTVTDGQGGQDTAQVTVTVSAPSLLVNGGFEDGLIGWEILGDASAQTAAFGETPDEAQSQGLVTNMNTAGGDVTVAELESFLGVANGDLTALAPGTATAGSAVRQTITVPVGAQLTFQYNFLTNESTPDGTYNDFSFFTISGPGVEQTQLLGDTYAGSFAASTSIYSESTGYQSVTYTFIQGGDYTIGFGVSDSQDTSYDSALLIDAVTLASSGNTPPDATDDTAVTAEDTAVTIDVLANDTDIDGDPLVVVAATQGNFGSVEINADDSVSYTPDADFNGTDSFTYTVSDEQGGQATGTVTVTVDPVNDAPVAVEDSANTQQDAAISVDVLANDSDMENDPLTIVIVGSNNGMALVNEHGTPGDPTDDTVQFTPVPGFTGLASFSYKINDSLADSNEVTVFIDVAAVAAGPNLRHGVASGVGSSGWTTIELDHAYDSMVVIASPNYDSTSASGVVRIRNASGSSFQVRVDSAGGTAISNVNVHYVVVEEGVYDEPGFKMEAVKFTSTVTDENNSWVAQQQSYQQAYNQPVVVGQVMSYNDSDWSVFWARGTDRKQTPSSSALYVGKHVGEDSDATRADEIVGYLVIEASTSGTDEIEGLPYVAAVGADNIKGVGDSPSYSYSYSAMPNSKAAVVSQVGMDGGNGGWPVLYGSDPITPTGGTLRLAIDEDQVKDSERKHTSEQVAYFIVDPPLDPSSATGEPDNFSTTSGDPRDRMGVQQNGAAALQVHCAQSRGVELIGPSSLETRIDGLLAHSAGVWGRLSADQLVDAMEIAHRKLEPISAAVDEIFASIEGMADENLENVGSLS